MKKPSAPLATLPKVLVGVPYMGALPGPFYESVVGLLQVSHRVTLDLEMVTVPNTPIHQARDALVRRFLKGNADYLLMVDSDQVFVPANVERLVSWRQPYVAAMIVRRTGPPSPVAFAYEREVDGMSYYSVLTDEVYAYLSQYRPERLTRMGSVGVLPIEPDHAPLMGDLPDAVVAGLDHPLLPCDAVGTGMVCLSRACAEKIDDGPDGHYFDWAGGGEDLSFSRRILKAGYPGFGAVWHVDPATTGGIFMDRGCLVGHLTQYSRGAGDLVNWRREVAASGVQDRPPEEPVRLEALV